MLSILFWTAVAVLLVHHGAWSQLTIDAVNNAFGSHGHHGHPALHSAVHHGISNLTIAGENRGCRHQSPYVLNSVAKVPMCMGQTDVDLKNGMSIINLVNSRGYLPTCRIMQLMLWMHAQVSDRNQIPKDFFIDVGANIGSCTVHMGGLGFPVISVEPVKQHVDTIQGTIDINPSMHIDLQHIGISSQEKKLNVNFGHGSRNWGASEFHEAGKNESFELELVVKSLDQVVGHRKVSLIKIDCEGCEWEAIKGGKRVLKRTPMLKIELVQPEYSSGNETVSAGHIINYLNEQGFDLFADLWNEQNLYFGKHGNDVMEIDKMFGSQKFNLPADVTVLNDCAKRILQNKIDVKTYNQRQFLKSYTDVIVIEKSLSDRMQRHWLHNIP